MQQYTQHNKKFILAACGSCIALAATGAQAQSIRLASVHAVRFVSAHNEQGGLLVTPSPDLPESCGLTGTWFEAVGSIGSNILATGARAVSPDGNVVVGWMMSPSQVPGGEPMSHPFIWTPCGGMQEMLEEIPGVAGGSAISVSTGGQVVVGITFGQSPIGYKQLSRTTTDVVLDMDSGFATSATSVSADGTVMVGSASDLLGRQAYIHTSGWQGVVALGDLLGGAGWSDAYAVSAHGDAVAGQALSSQGPQAFVWTPQEGMVGLGDLPGGAFESSASAISANGSAIVGVGQTASGGRAFRWTAQSGMVALGDLAGGDQASEALAISGNGAIVVGRSMTAAGFEAFIWDATRGMQRVEDVLASTLAYDFPDWILTAANGISSDGSVIVGTGINPDGFAQGWVAHIPVTHCEADYNNDGASNTGDYFAFLRDFFTGTADINGDGETDSQDFFAFFTAFFTGCE
ncbi:MAG: PEP-CTERM sorting domain-containing protein [Pyrinomonadaceae bacterium]|nr:PEP-CTERM sorting domain-containing protein [Phycisphaerales bacterium]